MTYLPTVWLSVAALHACRGAFEALNWVEALLADIEPAKDPRDQLKKVFTEVVVVVRKISEKTPQLQPRNASLNPP